MTPPSIEEALRPLPGREGAGRTRRRGRTCLCIPGGGSSSEENGLKASATSIGMAAQPSMN
jgi:hypothetical protein